MHDALMACNTSTKHFDHRIYFDHEPFLCINSSHPCTQQLNLFSSWIFRTEIRICRKIRSSNIDKLKWNRGKATQRTFLSNSPERKLNRNGLVLFYSGLHFHHHGCLRHPIRRAAGRPCRIRRRWRWHRDWHRRYGLRCCLSSLRTTTTSGEHNP